MKRTTNCLIAAATLLVAAGGASAQTLKAEIPFAFRVGATLMTPGTYTVTLPNMNTQALRLSHVDGGGSVMFLVVARNANKDWIATRTPKVAFACVDGQCSLSSVWDGESRDALEPSGLAKPRPEIAGAKVVILDAVRGE
jgi:hypothetical protein